MQHSQAHPPSEAQQLADARTASALAHGRIAELEEKVQKQREEIAKLEQEYGAFVAAHRMAEAQVVRERSRAEAAYAAHRMAEARVAELNSERVISLRALDTIRRMSNISW